MGSSGINVTQTFGYDASNRLSSMSETSGLSQSYGYDAYGNRALTGGYAPSPYLTPTSTSQFTGNWWLGSGSSTAGYDASGNQTQNTNGGNVFTFDAENRMATSNIGNMGVTSYVYDGEGRRIEKTSSTFTSYYVYDSSGDPVAEYTTETQPVYGTLYVTPDHLGSTRLLTNGNGDVVRRYDYLPFGEEIPSGSYSRGNDYGGNQYPNAGGSSFPGDAASHKFTGKERDAETGLDYFGARYFSGAQGRFTSADEFKGGGLFDPFTGNSAERIGPLPYADISDPQTLNKYGYVRNNPSRYVDPDGHADVDVALKRAFEVVSTTTKEAEAVAERGVGLGANAFGAFAMILLNPTPAAGKQELEFENSIKSRQQQNQRQAQDNEKEETPEKEAQAQSGNAGGRQRGGKPPKDLSTLSGTLTQVEGVENAQQAGREGKAPEIEHTDKSKQDLKNQLKKVKTQKDGGAS